MTNFSETARIEFPDDLARRLIWDSSICIAPGREIRTPPKAAPRTRVDLGWCIVHIAIRPSGEPKLLRKLPDAHLTRVTKGANLRRESSSIFWKRSSLINVGSAEYLIDFVRACGIPSLSDFKRTLRTPSGKDFWFEAEKAAGKRDARKGRNHDLTPGWMEPMYGTQRGLCALSGLPMYRAEGRLCAKIPVPDRIDASLGYVLQNIRLVRHGVNMAKRDLSDADFLELCRSVADHNPAFAGSMRGEGDGHSAARKRRI